MTLNAVQLINNLINIHTLMFAMVVFLSRGKKTSLNKHER